MAAAMLLMATDAFAQISVGAGYINSTTSLKLDSNKNTTNYNGFYVGGSYDINVVSGFSINPGLYYSFLTTGEKEIVNIAGIKATSKNTEHFMYIPVDFKYGFDLAPDCTLYAYAGPTFQFQVGQNYQIKALNGSWSDSDAYDDLSKFDVLIGGGVGAELLNCLKINVGYRYGLINLYNGDSSKITSHRSQILIGLAYMF